MRVTRLRRLPGLLAMTLTLTVGYASEASSQEHRLEISPYIGYAADMGSMMGGWSSPFGLSSHAGTGPTFGGRLGVRVARETFVEFSAGYSDAGSWFGGSGGHMAYWSNAWWTQPAVWRGAGEATLAYDGNITYGFRLGRWVPFVTAGFGAFTSWPDGGPARTDPVANFGAGVKAYVRDRFAFRADLRGYVGTIGRTVDPTGVRTGASRLAGHPQLTAGVTLGL